MQDRVGVDVRGEVVGRLLDEVPVRDVEECRPDTAVGVENLGGTCDRGVHDGGDEQRDDRGRQDPPNPLRIEATPTDATTAGEVAHENARDEESREDEEDIDPDEAAGEQAETGVEGDDEIDREGAHAVEVRPVIRGPATRMRHIPHRALAVNRHFPPVLQDSLSQAPAASVERPAPTSHGCRTRTIRAMRPRRVSVPVMVESLASRVLQSIRRRRSGPRR